MDIRFTCHCVMPTRRYREMSVITGELHVVHAIQGPRVGSRAGWVVVETFEPDRCRLRQIHRVVIRGTIRNIHRPHSYVWTPWT